MNKFHLIDKAKEIQKQNKFCPIEDINIFSILNMEYREVTAHSAMLFYIFKPFRDSEGNWDDKHLRFLLKEIFKDKNINNIKFLDISREVWTDFGRLDFLINLDDEVAVIELKILSAEQSGQINRYINYLETQNSPTENIFFLTPNDRTALTGKARNITLKREIKKVLKQIRDLRVGKTAYCTAIDQYITLIDKIVGEKVSNDNILKSSEDIIAVQKLIDERKMVLSGIMKSFFEKLKSEFSIGDKVAIEVDECPIAEIAEYTYGEGAIDQYYLASKKFWPALAFEIKDYKSNKLTFRDDIRLYFFIEIETNLYAGITPRHREYGNLVQLSFEEKQEYERNSGNKFKGAFLDWSYIRLDSFIVNFAMEKCDLDNSAVNLLLKKNSILIDEAKIKRLTEHIKTIYKEQCTKFLD